MSKIIMTFDEEDISEVILAIQDAIVPLNYNIAMYDTANVNNDFELLRVFIGRTEVENEIDE